MYRIIKKETILRGLNSGIYDSMTNINISYNFNWGSIIGTCTMIQTISGISVSTYYISTMNESYKSIGYIMIEVMNGELIRNIHSIGVSVVFIGIYMHITKGIHNGSYNRPRSMLWVIGVIMWLISIIISFMGYSLPLGNESYWAIKVICNLSSIIPYIGNEIVSWIWGNYYINTDTLNRFYTSHYSSPFILIGMIIIHIILLHENLGNNILGTNISTSMVKFNSLITIKDIYAIITMIGIRIIIVRIENGILEDIDNNNIYNELVTPFAIVPHWYLLMYYSILRCIESKSIGVICMSIGIIGWIYIAIIDYIRIRNMKWKMISRNLWKILIISSISLIWLGSRESIYIYIIIGKICTIYYFIYIFVICIYISIIENILYYK